MNTHVYWNTHMHIHQHVHVLLSGEGWVLHQHLPTSEGACYDCSYLLSPSLSWRDNDSPSAQYAYLPSCSGSPSFFPEILLFLSFLPYEFTFIFNHSLTYQSRFLWNIWPWWTFCLTSNCLFWLTWHCETMIFIGCVSVCFNVMCGTYRLKYHTWINMHKSWISVLWKLTVFLKISNK